MENEIAEMLREIQAQEDKVDAICVQSGRMAVLMALAKAAMRPDVAPEIRYFVSDFLDAENKPLVLP